MKYLIDSPPDAIDDLSIHLKTVLVEKDDGCWRQWHVQMSISFGYLQGS